MKRDRVLVLLALPGIALLLVFHYLPWLGNIIAFKDYQPYLGIEESPWVGATEPDSVAVAHRLHWTTEPGETWFRELRRFEVTVSPQLGYSPSPPP